MGRAWLAERRNRAEVDGSRLRVAAIGGAIACGLLLGGVGGLGLGVAAAGSGDESGAGQGRGIGDTTRESGPQRGAQVKSGPYVGAPRTPSPGSESPTGPRGERPSRGDRDSDEGRPGPSRGDDVTEWGGKRPPTKPGEGNDPRPGGGNWPKPAGEQGPKAGDGNWPRPGEGNWPGPGEGKWPRPGHGHWPHDPGNPKDPEDPCGPGDPGDPGDPGEPPPVEGDFPEQGGGSGEGPAHWPGSPYGQPPDAAPAEPEPPKELPPGASLAPAVPPPPAVVPPVVVVPPPVGAVPAPSQVDVAPPAAPPPPPAAASITVLPIHQAGPGVGLDVAPASFRAGYPEYLRDAALSEIAGLALPGVAGLMALTGVGGLMGYRQAKAGHAVRAAGTARFLQ